MHLTINSNRDVTFLLIVLILGFFTLKAHASFCPSDVTGFRGSVMLTKAASDLNRIITNLFVKSDLTGYYMISIGSNSSTTVFDNTLIEERYFNHSIVWVNGYVLQVQQHSAAIDSNQQNIYFSHTDGTNGYFGKFSTSNGAMTSYFQSDANMHTCNRLVLSPDEVYLYIACTDTTSGYVITEYLTSTFDVNFSFKVATNSLMSLNSYTRSGSTRSLIFSEFVTGSGFINVFSHTIPSSTTNFGNRIGCTTPGSCTTVRSAISLIMESRDQIAVAYTDDLNTDSILLMKLSTGAYENFFFQISADPSVDRTFSSIGTISSSNKLFLLAADLVNTGWSHLWIYNLETNTIENDYFNGRRISAMLETQGFFLSGRNDQFGFTSRIEYYNHGDAGWLSPYAFNVSGVAQMASQTHPGFVATTVTMVNAMSDRTISTFATPALHNDLNVALYTNEFSSPLNYRNASHATFDIPAGGNLDINLTIPCFAADIGNTTILVSEDKNINGEDNPSWVTLNNDNTSFRVNAPEILLGTTTYEVGFKFTYDGGESYSQYSTINLFSCGIAHCNV